MKQDSKYCGCLYYSANALSRLITKIADEEFSVTGLAPSYAFLLMTVNNNHGIQPMEIAEHMQLKPSTVTRLIDKMENKSFLERKSEGKKVYVFPTQKSINLQETLEKAWLSLLKRYTGILGEEKSRKLTEDIYKSYKILNTLI